MYHFLQSELLSRRLAYFCCKRISNIFNEYSTCFFEKTIKKLQSKVSPPTLPSLLKANSSNNLLSSLPAAPNSLIHATQLQKSPDLNPSLGNNSTKLKPFVTNLTSVQTTSQANTKAIEVVNYVLKKDVSIKSVRIV